MSYFFTAEDVQDLASNPSENTKIRLIDKLSEGFSKDSLSDEEIQLSEDILRLLASDMSISIRERISNQFANSISFPHDIAYKLAFDLEDCVAIPNIEKSKVLNEADLIEVLEKSAKSRQKAVAKRENLSPNLTAHIAHTTAADVVEVLIKNKYSNIPSNVSEIIVSKYSDNPNMLRAMIQNKKIDLTQAHDLLSKVSEDLKNMIIVEYNVPSTIVNNLIHNSKEWVMLSMLKSHAEDAPNSPSINQIINKLQHDGELTFSMLIKGLSVGNLVFFEASLAHIAGVPVENIRKLLWEVGSENGFKAIYDKCKFPESMQEAMWQLANIVRNERANDSSESITQRIHHSLVKASQAKQVRNLDYLVTIVAHNIRKLKK